MESAHELDTALLSQKKERIKALEAEVLRPVNSGELENEVAADMLTGDDKGVDSGEENIELNNWENMSPYEQEEYVRNLLQKVKALQTEFDASEENRLTAISDLHLAQSELHAAKSYVEDSAVRVAELEKLVEEKVAKVKEVTFENEELHKRIFDLHMRKESLLGEVHLLKDDIEGYRKRILDLERTVNSKQNLAEELNAMTDTLAGALNTLEIVKAEKRTLESTLHSNHEDSNAEISTFDIVDKPKETSDSEIESYKLKIDELSLEIKRLEELASASPLLQSENATLRKRVEQLEIELAEKETVCDDSKKKIAALEIEIKALVDQSSTSSLEMVRMYSKAIADSSVAAAVGSVLLKAKSVSFPEGPRLLMSALEMDVDGMGSTYSIPSIPSNSVNTLNLGPSVHSLTSLTRVSPRFQINAQAQLDALDSLKSEMSRRRISNSSLEKKTRDLRGEDLDSQSIETFGSQTPFAVVTVPSLDSPERAAFDQLQLERNQAAVSIQKIIRSFLARCRVSCLATEKAANEQGVLIAYRGTKQGNQQFADQAVLFLFSF